MANKKKDPKPLREQPHSEVYRFDDLSIFDLFPENRQVDQRSVLPLQRKIEKKNLLHLFPIVIDGEGRVLDGQRRLAAATNLGLSIYAVIANGEMGIDDVADVNHAAKSWTRNDYLHYWCQRGQRDYLILRDFWQRHQNWMTLSVACAVTLGESAASTLSDVQREAFNTGAYRASDMRFAEQFAEAMPVFLGVFRRAMDRQFMAAICYLLRRPDYDHRRMVDKVSRYPEVLTPQRDRDGYLGVLEDLYNRYAHGARVRFR